MTKVPIALYSFSLSMLAWCTTGLKQIGKPNKIHSPYPVQHNLKARIPPLSKQELVTLDRVEYQKKGQ